MPPVLPGRAADAKAPTAFILDDDPAVRAVLARLINAAHLRAEVFAAPDALVQRLAADASGCLVLDVRMPGLNGLDLYDALVAADKGLPVVFLSAYLDVGLTVRAMRAGAMDVLRKPWHGPTLVDAVKRGFDADVKRRRALEEERRFRSRFDTLTPRERDVMAHVVLGHANKVIGHDLGMSEKTVKAHRGHLMRKLGARGVADLVQIASRVGIKSDPH